MRDNDYPTEVSDPEASGLPDTADDDSNAYDAVESTRWADGADPAALAGVGPGGSNRFGDTAEEAREGESLDYRLRQEEPDVGAEDPLTRPARDPIDETVDELRRSAGSTRTSGARARPRTRTPRSRSTTTASSTTTTRQPVGRLVDAGRGLRLRRRGRQRRLRRGRGRRRRERRGAGHARDQRPDYR